LVREETSRLPAPIRGKQCFFDSMITIKIFPALKTLAMVFLLARAIG
jgi:hypothetical protein